MVHVASLLQTIIEHGAFRAACESVERPGPPVTLSGLTRPAKGLIVAALASQTQRPILVLTADNEAAERLRESTATFLSWLDPEANSSVNSLPQFDCSPYEGRSPHAEILEQRALALWNVGRGRTRVLYAPMAAALGRFREARYYASLALQLKVGDELSLEDLLEHLSSVGYEPVGQASEVGQYSQRGGIVDIFPPEAPWPFRLEFFGDSVESVREFDPSTQRSRKAVPSALLLPLSEMKRSRQLFEALVKTLAHRVQARRAVGKASQARPLAPESAISNVKSESSDLKSEISNFKSRDEAVPERGTYPLGGYTQHASIADGREPDWAPEYSSPFPGWEFFVPLVEPHPNSLLALLDRPVLVWDEPLDRFAQIKKILESLAASREEVRDVVPPRPAPEDLYFSETEFRKQCETAAQLFLKELAVQSSVECPGEEPSVSDGVIQSEAKPQTTNAEPLTPSLQSPAPNPEYVLLTQPAPKFQGNVRALSEDLQGRLGQGETVVIVTPTTGKQDRLQEILNEYKIPFTAGAGLETRPYGTGGGAQQARQESPSEAGVVLITRGEIEAGIVFPELRLAFLADSDLFGGFDWAARGGRARKGISTFISDLSDLKVGDYVVHIDHGIGLYRGLRQLEVGGTSRDFMLLTYQDEAKLYVPLERLDLVEKYRSSGDGAKPQLDRLGGATWERTKTRVKRALRDMAQELLRLYAERKMHGSTPTGPDTPWQKEFEDAFEFEETPDQLAAIAEIKRDLERPEPMDRLLCGDVGYGKTELALRAAFKVMQESRQVAVLAPTTVLAFQHYNTFRQRLSPFPLRVEMLSRFRSPAEQKKVVADTEAGKVDVLIGTHRLLSKDVQFRELGLLIVDEEQRFGVAAKEKLKKFKAGVPVLTMSATPIPRTLHMSLGGLRDLSVIETPPQGRLSIQTIVAPFSAALIQSAILQEMQRQGQVFFVHNRVESIFSMAALVQKLVPTARIGVAHGQMGEKELERVMMKFMQGEYDVLAATALIENGLDIPRANTMIVNHADRFGLADLYQLRGRVGRSNRRAYAYFLIAAEDALTPMARRRLAALKEFSDLGAGFRLAALDLELRGAGNLLGAEQHGHLNAIGIDLYLKMLEQSVEELKGAPPKLEVRASLNLGLDIKIPESYIADESQRLRMYKRISSLSSPEERADLEAELADRFGPIPESVSHLLDYALLKSFAEKLLVQSIERKADEIWVKFHEQTPVDPHKVTQFVRKRARQASFRPDGVLRVRLPAQDGNLIDQIRGVLQELQ